MKPFSANAQPRPTKAICRERAGNGVPLDSAPSPPWRRRSPTAPRGTNAKCSGRQTTNCSSAKNTIVSRQPNHSSPFSDVGQNTVLARPPMSVSAVSARAVRRAGMLAQRRERGIVHGHRHGDARNSPMPAYSAVTECTCAIASSATPATIDPTLITRRPPIRSIARPTRGATIAPIIRAGRIRAEQRRRRDAKFGAHARAEHRDRIVERAPGDDLRDAERRHEPPDGRRCHGSMLPQGLVAHAVPEPLPRGVLPNRQCRPKISTYFVERTMQPLILTVDLAGLPQAWVELEEAITYHAKQLVAWSVGQTVREFRGGYQRNGERSRIATKSILAIKGSGAAKYPHAPSLTNALLFARDRHVCALLRRAVHDPRPVARPREARWRAAAATAGPTPSPPAGAATRARAAARPSRRACRCSTCPTSRPARALHPAQPAHSRRPDGVPAGLGVEEQPPALARSRVAPVAVRGTRPGAGLEVTRISASSAPFDRRPR